MQKYIRPNQKALIGPDATHGYCIVYYTISDVLICMNSLYARLSA